LPSFSYWESLVVLRIFWIMVGATDGILEAAGPSDEEFGLQQLEALLKEHRSLPLPSIVQEIHSKLKSYHQEPP
jgi:serine phosphatase RsbU (regulator of sigma subunit)